MELRFNLYLCNLFLMFFANQLFAPQLCDLQQIVPVSRAATSLQGPSLSSGVASNPLSVSIGGATVQSGAFVHLRASGTFIAVNQNNALVPVTTDKDSPAVILIEVVGQNQFRFGYKDPLSGQLQYLWAKNVPGAIKAGTIDTAAIASETELRFKSQHGLIFTAVDLPPAGTCIRCVDSWGGYLVYASGMFRIFYPGADGVYNLSMTDSQAAMTQAVTFSLVSTSTNSALPSNLQVLFYKVQSSANGVENYLGIDKNGGLFIANPARLIDQSFHVTRNAAVGYNIDCFTLAIKGFPVVIKNNTLVVALDKLDSPAVFKEISVDSVSGASVLSIQATGEQVLFTNQGNSFVTGSAGTPFLKVPLTQNQQLLNSFSPETSQGTLLATLKQIEDILNKMTIFSDAEWFLDSVVRPWLIKAVGVASWATEAQKEFLSYFGSTGQLQTTFINTLQPSEKDLLLLDLAELQDIAALQFETSQLYTVALVRDALNANNQNLISLIKSRIARLKDAPILPTVIDGISTLLANQKQDQNQAVQQAGVNPLPIKPLDSGGFLPVSGAGASGLASQGQSSSSQQSGATSFADLFKKFGFGK